MSVMSAGRKPRALVRPLRAGNSRAGARPGQLRAGEPGTVASRPEKRNSPRVWVPAQPDSAVPPRPRSARKAPPRPRLWVVPDAPATAGSATSEPGVSEPGVSDPGSSGPGVLRPAAPGSRMPGDAPVRPPVGAGSALLVPRPRVAPDDQIQSHPSSRPLVARGAPAARGAVRDAHGPRRIRVPCPRQAGPADQAHPARAQAGLGFRGPPPHSADHPRPARRGFRGAGWQPRRAAVHGPGGHAAGSGEARPVPVVDRGERGASGRPAGSHPADHGLQRTGQPGRGARREPVGPEGLSHP